MAQTRLTDKTITIPAVHAEHIAHLLERCAEHEDERSRGRVTFPRVVMLELAAQAHHWARYLASLSAPSDPPPVP